MAHRPPPLTRIDLAVALGLVAATIVATASRAGRAVDDAWIVMRYARNLLAGHGWVYNVGDASNGSTSALNTLLMTTVGGVTGNLQLAQCIIFATCMAAAAWLVYLALRSAGRAPAALGAMVVVALPLPYSTLGLESAPMILGVCATALLFERRRLAWAGAALGLLVMARADGALLALPLALAHIGAQRSLRDAVPGLVRMFGTTLLVMLPWLVFAAVTFGSPLPSTLGAKLAQTRGGSWSADSTFLARAADSLRYLDARHLGLGAWPFLLLTAAGMAAAWRMRARTLLPLLIVGWAGLQFAAYSVLEVPAYHWYYVPAHLGIALAFVAIVLWIHGNAPRLDTAPRRHLATTWACALWLAVTSVDLYPPPGARYPHYHRTAAWLRDNTPPGASVAAMDIGVIGFGIGDRSVVDMCSLVHPGGVRAIAEGRTDWWLDALDPDYIAVHAPPREFFERPALERPDFAARYELIPDTGLRSMQVFRRRTAGARPR